MKPTNLLIALALCPFIRGHLQAQSALKRSLQSANYKAELRATLSSHQTPLWLNANRHGLSSVSGDNGYLRLALAHENEQDTTHNWRIGYGIDFALAKGFTSKFVLQQLYATLAYKNVCLTIGSKERPAELKHPLLSSGSQTFGTNARPIPQLCVETPNYIRLFKNNDWIKFKGHFSYGFFTDATFQKQYVQNVEGRHTTGVLYHAKAGYLRLGNEQRFPLVFEGGLEMASVFGGTIHYKKSNTQLKMPTGIGTALKAIYGGGSDPTDGPYDNVSGNMLGSWIFSLSYQPKDWKVRAYLDHFFEDHSQLFFQYAWKDGLMGLEITPPKNKVFNALVYEFISTRDQTGAILHNRTSTLPYQISGGDNYYNHGLYLGWQHWGQAIGNPLYYSPLYKNNGSLTFDNRFRGHHVGISGQPTNALSYRLLFSHTKNWGTHEMAYPEPQYKNSLLAELNYSVNNPTSPLHGWNATLGIGHDGGNQHGRSFGVCLTISKTGILF